MVQPGPGERGKISFWEQEYWELEISRGSGFCSAVNGDKISPGGQHPWPIRATQTWRAGPSWKHEHQDERFHEEQGTADVGEPPEPEDGEIRRTHHREQRVVGSERSQWRE